MVDYGIGLIIGIPDDEALLRAVRDFAIYNSILGVVLVFFSYTATVLMNMSAYNQVIYSYKLYKSI